MDSHTDRSLGIPYVVQSGDTLWDVAARHLGDPRRWPEIAKLSSAHLQPDGRRLEDPHWIYPGWRLTLPPDAIGVPTPSALAEPSPSASTARGGTQQ